MCEVLIIELKTKCKYTARVHRQNTYNSNAIPCADEQEKGLTAYFLFVLLSFVDFLLLHVGSIAYVFG